METLGAFPSGEWDCIGTMFEDDGNINGIQSMFFSTLESEGNNSMFHSFDSHNSNLQYLYSQESSDSSNCSDPFVFMGHRDYNFSYLDHVLANSTTSTSMDFCMMDEKKLQSFVEKAALDDIVMEENVNLKLKRMLDESELEDKINSYENPKKKPCVTKDVQGCMKNAQNKKNQKVKEAEETNAGLDGHSSSSYYCTSEEENNNSQENNGVTSASKPPLALNSNGKTRASRGSATDPQSLYARKRRERINERLKILQNIVPNGTKVDISTMLEEAVQYVKFLQLQIKLLSSDDLWMYAPIAYNGLDIGINLIHKNSPTL